MIIEIPLTVTGQVSTTGGTTLVLPAMQASVVSSYVTQGAHVRIKRGDGRVLPVQIAGDWSTWTARCGAKEIEDNDAYAIGPITGSAGSYDAGTDSTLFNFTFTAEHTANAFDKLKAEVELSKAGSDQHTPVEFLLSIKKDIVRDVA